MKLNPNFVFTNNKDTTNLGTTMNKSYSTIAVIGVSYTKIMFKYDTPTNSVKVSGYLPSDIEISPGTSYSAANPARYITLRREDNPSGTETTQLNLTIAETKEYEEATITLNIKQIPTGQLTYVERWLTCKHY